MKYYKELLLRKLANSGWELVEIDEDTDWWLESVWRIKSIRQNYGLELFISFLVDPQYDGVNKSSAVYSIEAFKEFPHERPLKNGLASLYFLNGKLNRVMEEFLVEINYFRNKVNEL